MNATLRAILVGSSLVAAYLYQHFFHPSAPTPHTHPDHFGDLPLPLPAYSPNLFAIADIHGDFPRAHAALLHAGVVDRDGSWAAGNATLVQTGDIVDRGPDTQKLYTWFRNLTVQAESQGGKVVKLWGNHEYMNAAHDWRYVDPLDLDTFPDPSSQTRLDAFSTTGSIGSDWLIDYAVTYRDPLYRAHFMHAGLDIHHASLDTNAIGAEFMRSLLSGHRSSEFWNADQRAFYSADGPMWYRGYALLPEHDACEIARTVMEILDVRFLVMGHTPNFDGALTRCGGRVLLIDTGLSSAYGGRPVVLQFLRGSMTGDAEVKLWYDDDRTVEVVYPPF